MPLLPRGYQKVKFNPLIACPRPRGKKLPPTSWGLAMADGAIDNPSSPSILSLVVKFGARSFPLSLPSDSTVKDLKTLLQPLTNVIPRGQKLIFKGKVLTDAMSIGSAQVSNGSKIMLMASRGLHQGDGPITSNTCTPSKSGSVSSKYSSPIKPEVHMQKSRIEHWKVTGVVALSGYHLKVVPEEVWACGAAVRVLDLSDNSLQQVPLEIGKLMSLRRLVLNSNSLLDGAIIWESVSSLKLLTILSLNENQLTTLPSVIGSLTSLRELHIAKNNLISLPEEIQFLSGLQVFKAGNNRLSSLPSCIGDCVSLVEADFSSNYLVELPDTLSNLHNLKTLILANNGLKNLPTAIFKSCLQLSYLDLHRTEITVDQLHKVTRIYSQFYWCSCIKDFHNELGNSNQVILAIDLLFAGWEEFDERRKAKHQKQLDFRVGFNSMLDEGADEDNGPRY